MYGATAGVAAVTYVNGAINQAILAMVPKRIDGEFLYHWLSANRFAIIDRYTQGGQPNLSGAIVRRIEMPVPPLTEQRAIVTALNDADRAVEALECLISKKRDIKQGMMQRLLTGRTRLPGFSEDWEHRSLSHLLSYEQPGPFLVRTTRQLEMGRTPVLTAGKTFVLGYTNETEGVYRNHPVIIFDDFTTASKYVDFDFKAKSSAMKILSARPGVDLRFLYERMQLLEFPLGDHKRYWISEYSHQAIDVPSPREQAAIANVISDTTAEIDFLAVRLKKAQDIKQGMMQELLTGRTRLVPQEVSA